MITKIRKLLALLGLLTFLSFYAFFASLLGAKVFLERGIEGWAILYYFLAGFLWIWPAIQILKWMRK
ncbi:MAG: DUF2842 domain-containing protein [Parvibaculales bacterium]